MDDDNIRQSYNAKSGVDYNRLDERDRGYVDSIRDRQASDEQRLEETYAKTRYMRHREELEKLYKHHRAELAAPRPVDAPVPALPTWEELQGQAWERVKAQHEQNKARVRDSAEAAVARVYERAEARGQQQGQQRGQER